jgi:hypothetical protein
MEQSQIDEATRRLRLIHIEDIRNELQYERSLLEEDLAGVNRALEMLQENADGALNFYKTLRRLNDKKARNTARKPGQGEG